MSTMTLQQLTEAAIARLIKRYQRRPEDVFHEKELHVLFAQCMHGVPNSKSSDTHEISLFRHEYNSVYRYEGTDYLVRPKAGGKAASIDFAVLRPHFVSHNKLLTVINKDERRRRDLRQQLNDSQVSPTMEIAIEFKMAHRRVSESIGQAGFNLFRKSLVADCRKLKFESATHNYVVGFSHDNDRPTDDEMDSIFEECGKAWKNAIEDISLDVVIVTPKTYRWRTCQGNNWSVKH